MKNLKIVISILIMILSTNYTKAEPVDKPSKKILVVYYSWSGNTEYVAKYVQEMLGADIFEIELIKPFSDNYSIVAQEYRKDNSTGTNRKLKKTVENLSSYDIIFIGTPIWGGTRALPVKSFLIEHDLTGKTVVPFATHGGGGEGRCFIDMKREAPEANFLDGFSLTGNQVINSKNAITKWLQKLGITKSNN